MICKRQALQSKPNISYCVKYGSCGTTSNWGELSDPIQVHTNISEACVVLAVLNDETGNTMHSPGVVPILAHKWTAAVSSAGIDFGLGAITGADHVVGVEAMASAYNWQHGLLQNVR